MKALVQLIRANQGNVAVEFALIAPVFVIMILGLADFGKLALERSDMLAAARSGGQYFMTGGTDTARAETIINASWTGKPENGTVSVTRVCTCSRAAWSCNTVCTTGDIPVSHAHIDLSATVDGIFMTQQFTSSEEVRLR